MKDPDEFVSIPGKGVRAKYMGRDLLVGSIRLMKEKGVRLSGADEVAERMMMEGRTVVAVALDNDVIGLIGLMDSPKPYARHVIEILKRLGIKVLMITGDNERTAKAVATMLGIEQVMAEVLPGEKASKISELQEKGHLVGMVGDGVNDAPALTQADVGFAIGSGTDVAIEAGDIVLIRNDLRDIVAAIQLSKRTVKQVKQNLAWAFGYNTILIPLAALGKLYPICAGMAMALSSISVTSWSLTLRRCAFNKKNEIRGINKREKNFEKPFIFKRSQGKESSMLHYLRLLKLKQTSLLVLTGLASMIAAAGKIPPIGKLLLFTSSLVLAIAGTTAMNMYFDRDIDAIMKRTKNRPLPKGEIDPQWKAVLLGLLLFSIGFLLALKIGFLIGLLGLLGLCFNILVYTLAAKRKTPLSVVFGGVAGAAPSLAGWAAIKGSLELEGILMALLIMLWIPEHIWTLSSYYVDDYKSAGVPMLPVVWGIRRSALATLAFSFGTSAVSITLGYKLELGAVYFACCLATLIFLLTFMVKFYLDPSPNSAFKAFKAANISLGVLILAIIISSLLKP